MLTKKINVAFDDINRARLSSRQYDSKYVPMPNTALPSELKEDVGIVYRALTGEGLSKVGHTFTVSADELGYFRKVLSPTLCWNDEDALYIQWGDEPILLGLDEQGGGLYTKNSGKNVKFGFKEEKIGKYDNTVLNVSVRDGDKLITMPIPVRSKDFENPPQPEILDLFVEEGNLSGFGEWIGNLGSGGNKLDAYVIKISQLPIGTYNVFKYWSKDTQWGEKFYCTIDLKEDQVFMADTRVKNDKEIWETKNVEISGYVIIQGNTFVNRVLAAKPIISLENPAKLKITEHYVTSGGHPAVKGSLLVKEFVIDEDSIDLDF